MKTCTCCGQSHSIASFVLLLPAPPAGGSKTTEDGLEVYRNCGCGSTLMVILPLPPPYSPGGRNVAGAALPVWRPA